MAAPVMMDLVIVKKWIMVQMLVALDRGLLITVGQWSIIIGERQFITCDCEVQT